MTNQLLMSRREYLKIVKKQNEDNYRRKLFYFTKMIEAEIHGKIPTIERNEDVEFWEYDENMKSAEKLAFNI